MPLINFPKISSINFSSFFIDYLPPFDERYHRNVVSWSATSAPLLAQHPLGFDAYENAAENRANAMPMKSPVQFTIAILIVALTAACTGHQTRPYAQSGAARATDPAHVVVLLSDPTAPFTKLGAVSVKKAKVGWTAPSVTDAQEEIQKAGSELGADAVIVRSTQTDQNKILYVEGEAIRYNQ